jgi:porin
MRGRWCGPLLAALLLGPASGLHAQTPQGSDAAPSAIAGNPGAVNVTAGTGALGRLLGLSPDSGVQLGGVLVSNGNDLLSGGNQPGKVSFNNLLVTCLQADLDKLAHIPGATFGVALLRFDGQPSNQQAGTVTGYNGLTGAPPLDRTELYELWWRQSLFDDKLIVRIGKTAPTYDFGNVARPVPVRDLALAIPATTGLIYTPVFVNPTILGALPGYYNSAYGITTTIAPTQRLYVSLGVYDGNLAHGVQTGLLAAPTINGNRFQIGEVGTAWILEPGNLPGSFSAGAWDQTGTLTVTGPAGTVSQNGTQGAYVLGSQRLWGDGGATAPRSVSGFMQAGANDSQTMLATRYVGVGATAFGLIPGRPRDSFGAGLAWSWLNQHRNLRANEALLQSYAQFHVVGDVFLQPALTVSPTPAEKTARSPSVAFTLQSTVLF